MAEYNSQTLPPIHGGGIIRKNPQPAIHLQVCQNGNNFYKSKRTLNKNKMSFESWMEELSVFLRVPVRRLYTPTNGHLVRNLDDFTGGETIVAAGQERFKKLSYTDITGSPRRRETPRNHDWEPGNSRLYNQVSGKIKNTEIHNKIIRVHLNGNTHNCPRTVKLVAQKINTLHDVLLEVDKVMQTSGNGVTRLFDTDGNRITDLDQIHNKGMYVALNKDELFTHAAYPEQGVMNFSNSRNSIKLPQIQPRSNKTSSHSSPDNSHHGYRRDRMRQETGGVFNGRAVQHKRSSQRHDVNYDRDNGPFRNKNQNPHTRDARPVEDSRHTKTERPIDDRPAETVQDEEFGGHNDYEDDPWADGDYQEEQIGGKKNKKGKKEEGVTLPPIQDRTHRSNARTNNSPGNEEAQREAAARRQAEDRARAERTQRERETAEQRRRDKEEQKKREQEERQREQEERKREQEEKRKAKEREQEDKKKARQADRKQDKDKAAKGNDKKDSKAAKNKSPAPASKEEEAAATKIQAGYRGYKTRRELKKKHKEEEEVYGRNDSSLLRDDPIPLADDDWGSNTNNQQGREDEAATKIQAAFRGHQTRKEVRGRRHNQEG